MILAQIVQPHIDTGQIVISIVLAILAWFLNRLFNKIDERLDGHDRQILDMKVDIARWDGHERRFHEKDR